ncbi:MAG: glycan-binding surface protein [Tannerella sp.]|nr:glycan-binding surface protein [Tannerella sp.]
MKNIICKITFALLAISILFACEDKDDGDTGGKPVVRYVRPCDAAVSDSLLTSAYLGNEIAIIGENLAGVNAIFFNDQKAKLNPQFVTNTSIIVTIPNRIPNVKQDIIKLCTRTDTLIYPGFETKVPAPTVNSMTCEFVEDGDIAYIQGLYFVNDGGSPLKVYFVDDVEGEIMSSDLNNIAVKVPVGAQTGPVTVESVYGKTESTLWFRDNRNIILDFNNGHYPDYDYFFGWHGGSGVSTDNGINGNYLILGDGSEMADDTWNDSKFGFEAWTYLASDPDFFDVSKLNDYVCKFEANVTTPWSAAALQIIFTGADEVMLNWQNGNGLTYNAKYSGANGYVSDETFPRGLWQPWTTSADKSFKTDGWITITVPMNEFVYNASGSKLSAPNAAGHYSGITLFLNGGGVKGTPCNPVIWIDNVRIVKK